MECPIDGFAGFAGERGLSRDQVGPGGLLQDVWKGKRECGDGGQEEDEGSREAVVGEDRWVSVSLSVIYFEKRKPD